VNKVVTKVQVKHCFQPQRGTCSVFNKQYLDPYWLLAMTVYTSCMSSTAGDTNMGWQQTGAEI